MTKQKQKTKRKTLNNTATKNNYIILQKRLDKPTDVMILLG